MLQRRGWLTDRHMYAVNVLLQSHFPHLQGLQSKLLQQVILILLQLKWKEGLQHKGHAFYCHSTIHSRLMFVDSLLTPQVHVQIHYVPEYRHWIASGYFDGQVKIYDSLFSSKLPASIST